MKRFMEKWEELLELGGTKKNIAFLVISGIALIMSIMKISILPVDMAWVAIIFCGLPIISEAVIGLVTAFDIKADVLVSMALIASVIIGEDFAAGEVAFIMQLGALLEDLTVAKARAGIEKLVHLTPQTARIIARGGVPQDETVILAELVQVGDVLRVLPGETVPADGVIVKGQTSVNQAVMTGESMPVDKTVGDEVSSGTVNQFGTFEMRAEKVGEDSSIRRMIRLVQSADAGKAKIVGMADRWATWVVVTALTAAVLTFFFTHEILRSVTILVVFCPCSLVLATPTAIMAGIGNATKHGFLVREGDALERLATVKKVTFDKTGTLTLGNPAVKAVRCCGGSSAAAENGEGTNKGRRKEDGTEESRADRGTSANPGAEDLYRLTASAERFSEHPLGKAVVQSFRASGGKLSDQVTDFAMIPGQGVSAVVDGQEVMAGNRKMFAGRNIVLSEELQREAAEAEAQGSTVIFTAVQGKTAGFLTLSDTLRSNAENMIREVTGLGVTPVLLTGDNENAAQSIAGALGIKEVHAGCLPEDKLSAIDGFQKSGSPVLMIGDGVNDAPALKKADVGIAMGGIGSDIAVDAADIALVNDDVKELPHLLALSKRMMTTIRCNLTFSMTLNFIAIVLAITGILNPVVGALVHNCGSVLVITNSALLLGWKRK